MDERRSGYVAEIYDHGLATRSARRSSKLFTIVAVVCRRRTRRRTAARRVPRKMVARRRHRAIKETGMSGIAPAAFTIQ